MQNLASKSEQHIDVAKLQVTPPSDHGLTPVIQLYDSRLTIVTPNQTLLTPPTHTGLSCKQARVLDNLARNAPRRTNYRAIGEVLGISKSAARNAVAELVSKGYISAPITIRDGVFQGFSYWIDNAKCQLFLETGGALNAKYHALTPPTHTVCPQPDPPHTISSSYNSDSKLTTQTVDLADPELLWWTGQGLTSRQIISWLDQFRMQPEELAQSLRFARFDAVVNEVMSNGKPIEHPQNWFYTICKRAGTYPRPKNYKSIYEIRANELEEQQRHDDAAKVKIWEAEIGIKFKELMNDRESPLFQELFCKVGEFAKDDQFTLEIEMLALLKEKYPK